ncbi:MAG: hypothetical protein CHACPFDD_02488 [Phycisphaerae bacterium]|nr:hypothetical protein [Phycisphaerae bacterium]
MLAGVWTIYRKELVDTLRDRKTLVFMLLIPAAAIPLMFAGINALVQRAQRQTAVEVVRIASDADSQRRYVQLVHQWFLGTQLQKTFRLAASPLFGALLKPEQTAGATVPGEIFDDPAAFQRWTQGLARAAREGIDDPADKSAAAAQIELPDALRTELVEFYRVALKGLGLVEFIDPAVLAPPPPGFVAAAGRPGRPAVPGFERFEAALRAKELHGYLVIPPEAERIVDAVSPTVLITLIHDSTLRLSKEAGERVAYVVEQAGQRVVELRLAARQLDASFVLPLDMQGQSDLATESQIAMAIIGGILPYFVIAFAFLGGMYPAIDLGAGEKERNTLETLILAPASRLEIAFGKFLVILTTALIAAFAGLLSIVASVRYLDAPELLKEIQLELSPVTALLVALLAIPPAAAFAGLFLAISIYARSFKEAQNYIAPLQFVLILPAMAPMLPGMEINATLAMIPLVNVSILSKELLRGAVHWGYYVTTFLSCFVFAGACVAYAVRQFSREQVLFRS